MAALLRIPLVTRAGSRAFIKRVRSPAFAYRLLGIVEVSPRQGAQVFKGVPVRVDWAVASWTMDGDSIEHAIGMPEDLVGFWDDSK